MKHRRVALVTLVLAGLAAAAAAEIKGSGADDLAVVKKAVAAPSPGARPARVPQWFKVRIVDKTDAHKKVTVNVPLSVVRALGDETIDWGCHDGGDHGRDHARCHTIRISEILRTLEAGRHLVEVDDEEATVKVWVE